MKHCHISIMCNELPFLKQKLSFLYDNYEQIIFVDYNLHTKSNSTDGSIEFIEGFDDPFNKIILIKDFDPDEVTRYRGVSFIEKRKMFAVASQFVKDDIDIVWATDLDEFFYKDLIKRVEDDFSSDSELQSIDIPHKIFVYNQYNIYNKNDFYIAPRITRHKKGFLYGHCDFGMYGKTKKYTDIYLFHYAFIGYRRCFFKFLNIYKNSAFDARLWLKTYLIALKNKDRLVSLRHSNVNLNLYSTEYTGSHPDYIDIDELCAELNS